VKARATLTTLLLAATGFGLWLAPTEGGAAPLAEAVTMSVSGYVNPNKVRVLVFEGTIASNAAREYVEVLGRECGASHDRLIAGTQTVGDGRWHVENPNPNPPWNYTQVFPGTTFRARWNNQYSAPYFWSVPAPLYARKVPGRRAWRVYVSPPPPGRVSMKGKIVELQRLSGGSWVRVRRARLVYKPRYEWGGAFNHEAVFAVRARRLTLRAFLPSESAAPCYHAGASNQWRS
jgi:hypothetical protein